MTPAACRSVAVSWIEAITSLRYCLVIASNLLQRAGLQSGGNLRVAVIQQLRREHSEGRKFVVPNVALITLGKAVNEERTLPNGLAGCTAEGRPALLGATATPSSTAADQRNRSPCAGKQIPSPEWRARRSRASPKLRDGRFGVGIALAHSALASCWARKLRSMIGA